VRNKRSSEGNHEARKVPDPEPLTPNLVHTPVLLRETISLMAPRPGGIYLDGTLGAGGHAAEILNQSAPNGIVIGLDQDAEAIERCSKKLSSYGSRAIIRRGNFRDAPAILSELGYDAVDGVLLDLGISWFHLKTPDRGFSFMLDGPLDMRMDDRKPRTAADLVNSLSRDELTKILREYGEEPRANAIARAIERARAGKPITSTIQLAHIVSGVYPARAPRRIHPATLTFQALRIAVNDELTALQDGVARVIPLVRPGGRIAVITFHSLEDRIVKQTFVREAKGCICPPKMPICSCGVKPRLNVLTHRPVKAGPDELIDNPASRSAKLRVAEKL